jgi:hypothetical protein
MAGGLCDRSWIDLALMGRLKLSTSADRKCRKPMQKEFGLQEKNLTYSDFFYFYNSSNSISLSVSGFKVTADGIFR